MCPLSSKINENKDHYYVLLENLHELSANFRAFKTSTFYELSRMQRTLQVIENGIAINGLGSSMHDNIVHTTYASSQVKHGSHHITPFPTVSSKIEKMSSINQHEKTGLKTLEKGTGNPPIRNFQIAPPSSQRNVANANNTIRGEGRYKKTFKSIG